MFFREFCEIFKNAYFYRTPPVAASENLKLIVILRKPVLLCFCLSPSQLLDVILDMRKDFSLTIPRFPRKSKNRLNTSLDVIRSGTLLCGVTTWNSAPILSSTWNRNTQVGAEAVLMLI